MPVNIGDRFGHYDIVALLGEGGMGRVYRATDAKLRRDVALKMLPEAFLDDGERLDRFEREARVLASLNHPNIAAIYGLEERPAESGRHERALVLELVGGPTLADRINQRPIPLDEAVPIARQIAEALEAAHDAGVVHRDLKPANIKLRADGTVKVLDFGLAKALEPASSSSAADGVSQSPTVTGPLMTQTGVILGTAAYMSPEQARGIPVDKRADVWAFGVVLYEMLAGRRMFASGTATELLAQILEREPDWSALPKNTPANVRRLLKRCLQKDPRRRLRDCGDAVLELNEVPESAATQATAALSRRVVTVGVVGIVIGAIGALVAVGSLRSEDVTSSPSVGRFPLLMSGESRNDAGRLPFAISPDGRHVVYAARQQLRVRSIDDLTSRAIQGTEPIELPGRPYGNAGLAIQPILSPDGRHVAYFQGGQLKRVAVTGGAPSVICACGDALDATWGHDDGIWFGRGIASGDIAGGVWRVDANGGTPERVIAGDAGETVVRPQLLPDGRYVLFTRSPGTHWDQADVVVQSLTAGDRQVLVKGAVDGRYVASGHLLFGRGGTLHAVRFNADRRELEGKPVPVLADVAQATAAGAWGGFEYAVSQEGTLVYAPVAARAIRRVLTWVDRDGREERLAAEPRAYQYPRFSPDGRFVALDLRDQLNDVWIWDTERATLTRATVGRRSGGPAVWTHDGHALVFGPDVNGVINLHVQSVSGGATPRPLTQGANTKFADVVTPDGQWLVYADVDPQTGFDLRLLRLDGSEGPRDLLRTPFDERNAHLSPDGRWIAYQSDESGRFEVYVRPFPRVSEGRWQVSTTGGTRPLWGRDGRELFYLDAARRMTAVAFRPMPLSFGPPQTLFETASFGVEGQQRNYDLAPDGQRFLMVRNLPPPLEVPSLVLVRNWFQELRATVP